MCARMLSVGGVGWLEKTLSDEDDTWGWLCCRGGGMGLLEMGQDSMETGCWTREPGVRGLPRGAQG